MAAFHFSAKIHSRADGRSAVRSAAYRAAERLYDARAGRTEDYTEKGGVIETAILAPFVSGGSPGWVQDRNELWNRVEAREKRRDSQVAQELEINLPRELSDEDNWQLAVDFARAFLVADGRVCDIAFHMGRASDGGPHPHVHILMPTRLLAGETFGAKHPDCHHKTFPNRRVRLRELREAWCDFARARALELGHDLGPEWDHRSLEDRGIDLEPQPKRGATAQRLDAEWEADGASGGHKADAAGAAASGGRNKRAERTEEWLAAQRRNGEALLRNPGIALDAITQRHSTFSDADLARYIFQHCANDQFAAIMAKAQPLAVLVGHDEHGKPRLSTPAMVALERQMVADAAVLAKAEAHTVGRQHVAALFSREGEHALSAEQASAAAHLLRSGDLACLTGYAGSGKSTLLKAAREAWEAEGYTVKGAALSGIAAEGLRTGSGIRASTIASLTYAWDKDREPLTARDVLVIDEAGMVGSRQLARLVERARAVGAKIVLVGDPEQLQAIDAGAAYRAIAERVGAQHLTEIWRQRADWQKEATRKLAENETGAALAQYRAADCIEVRQTDADARLHLVERWAEDRLKRPDGSRIMLTNSLADMRALNAVARDLLRADGQLGLAEVELETNFGDRAFAAGDRLIFRRNEKTMDVRNGTIGTVSEVEPGRFAVRLDDGRSVAFDPTVYKDIDHGYAVTCHRAQGVTVDNAFVLATRGFDRHLTYVACTRHRDSLTLVHSRDAFATDGQLAAVLGRERAKDTTLDYEDYAECREQPGPWGWAGTGTGPAPRPTDDFMRAHAPKDAPQRSTPGHEPSETEQAFAEWAKRSPDIERGFEWKPKDRGWGL